MYDCFFQIEQAPPIAITRPPPRPSPIIRPKSIKQPPPEPTYTFSKFSDIVFNRAEEGASSHFSPRSREFINDRVFNPYDEDEEEHEWDNESRFKQYDKGK